MTLEVWITRTPPGGEATARRVRAMGLGAVVAPLLYPEAMELVPPAPDEDVIFTSTNGVRFFKGATGRTAWCVGEATAKAARGAGFADVRVGPGDVAELAARMTSELARPAVHWGGAHVRGDLVGELARAGHRVRRVVAYRARAVEGCPVAKADVVLLHSSRAAQAYARLCTGRVRASVAISAATDAPLSGTSGGLMRFVADAPTEAAMLRTLREASAALERGTL